MLNDKAKKKLHQVQKSIREDMPQRPTARRPTVRSSSRLVGTCTLHDLFLSQASCIEFALEDSSCKLGVRCEGVIREIPRLLAIYHTEERGQLRDPSYLT